MKSNLRNEIKSYIVRQGMTMQEVVDLLHDEHGWSDSVSNLSNKLQRESLRYIGGRPACRCAGARNRLAETKVRRNFHMTDDREETVASAAPLGGSAGAGSGQGAQSHERVDLFRRARFWRKVLPEVRTMELSALEGYLSRKLGKQI